MSDYQRERMRGWDAARLPSIVSLVSCQRWWQPHRRRGNRGRPERPSQERAALPAWEAAGDRPSRQNVARAPPPPPNRCIALFRAWCGGGCSATCPATIDDYDTNVAPRACSRLQTYTPLSPRAAVSSPCVRRRDAGCAGHLSAVARVLMPTVRRHICAATSSSRKTTYALSARCLRYPKLGCVCKVSSPFLGKLTSERSHRCQLVQAIERRNHAVHERLSNDASHASSPRGHQGHHRRHREVSIAGRVWWNDADLRLGIGRAGRRRNKLGHPVRCLRRSCLFLRPGSLAAGLLRSGPGGRVPAGAVQRCKVCGSLSSDPPCS